MRRRPDPSGRTTYTLSDCRRSQLPGTCPASELRSELKASHCPSGDHAGRKSLPKVPDTLRTRLFARSISHTCVRPVTLDETNARVFPSGDRTPWSLKLASFVSCSRPEPSG